MAVRRAQHGESKGARKALEAAGMPFGEELALALAPMALEGIIGWMGGAFDKPKQQKVARAPLQPTVNPVLAQQSPKRPVGGGGGGRVASAAPEMGELRKQSRARAIQRMMAPRPLGPSQMPSRQRKRPGFGIG